MTPTATWPVAPVMAVPMKFGRTAIPNPTTTWRPSSFMTLACPAGTSWYFDPDAWKGSCAGESEGGVGITSTPPTRGIDAGGSYSYQVVASSAASDPLTYSLTGQPDGMAIDASGLINWATSTTTSGTFNFRVVASDGKGGRAVQPVSLTVCAPPQKWHAEGGHCM